MNCVQRVLCVCVVLSVLAGISIISSLSAPEKASQGTPADLQVTDQNGSDEARWKDGELLPPLPKDPVRRAEAIRMAKENGRALEPSSGAVQPAGRWTRGPSIQPVRITATRPSRAAPDARPRADLPFQPPLPVPGEAFRPTAEQLRESARDVVKVGDPRATPTYFGPVGTFDAIDYTGWTPPCPDIAVGPENILVATTDVFAVYDKCGNWIDGGVAGERFPIYSGYTWYAPRVVYDDWSGRWVMAYTIIDYTVDQSAVVLVISNSADLDDGWGGYYLANVAAAGSFADDVYLSVDPEGIYVTFNQFHFDTYTYEGAFITAFDKTQAYDLVSVTTVGFSCSTNPGDGTLAFSVRPAQMRSYAGKMYFLNNKSGGGSIFTLWSLNDPFGTPAFNKTSVSVAAYAAPPKMRQPNGTYVNGGDCRLADLVYDSQSLYTVFSQYLLMGGNDISMINVLVFGVSPAAYQKGHSFYHGSGDFVAYPSLDLDEYDRLGIQYSYCSYLSSLYLSTAFMVWDFESTDFSDLGNLTVGLANFTLGGSGTVGSPYRWGSYTGCAIDPVDDRTFWMVGPYASNDPTPSWMTQVAAVSGFVWSNLAVEPSELVASGVYGESMVNTVLPATLSNTSQTVLNWEIDDCPWWLTPSALRGQIPPGGSQEISFYVGEEVRWLLPGEYVGSVHFKNCTGYWSLTCTARIFIVEPVTCPYAVVSTAPPTGPASTLSGTAEYSVFITAMEDISVCAMGLALAEAEPAELGCAVYEANGTTRGALLDANTQYAVQEVNGAYLVAMDADLQACNDYEIVFTHAASVAHLSYNEADFSYPFDANGIVRVRQSATDGSVGDPQHPSIVILGSSQCDEVSGRTTDLYPGAAEHPDEKEVTLMSTESGQGLFITARENRYLCSVEFEADLVRDQWLVARVFETGAGYVRTSTVGEGYAPIETGGLARHEIPIHARLKAGQSYNVSVAFWERGYWPAVPEGLVTVPYTIDGEVEVMTGEFNGSVSPNLPHLWLHWEDFAARGAPFDLAKSADGIPGPNAGSGAIDHGVFVQPAATQEVYSLGLYADIPEGTTITARIYRLSIAGTRGPLQTEGTIVSGGAGMRWHDVPVSLRWSGGTRYDISFVCSSSTSYRYWLDTSGMPYSPYGIIQVQTAEYQGNTSGTRLLHLRVNACNEAMTAIGDEPPLISLLSLDPPAPNPAGGLVRFRYSIDTPGAADLEIYDVTGRRVASVFAGRPVEAGPGEADFDTAGLASGVYFLKLTVGDRAVSRKIVVMR